MSYLIPLLRGLSPIAIPDVTDPALESANKACCIKRLALAYRGQSVCPRRTWCFFSPSMNSLNVSANANSAVLEAAYESWQQNPESVDPTWRAFFQGFTLGNSGGNLSAAGTSGVRIVDSYKQAQVGR